MKRNWYELASMAEPAEQLNFTCEQTSFRTSPTSSLASLPLVPSSSPGRKPFLKHNNSPKPSTEPSSPEPVSSESDDEVPVLDQQATTCLSRALKVDSANVPCEAYSYSVLCKHKRGSAITREDVVELWHCIPRQFKFRDSKQNGGKYAVFGANPRKQDQVTTATNHLPHALDLLVQFIRQTHPNFQYSTIS